MEAYIVLLRGINVGGHHKVPMAELRELLTKEGFENVKTYIQSGNIVVHSLEKSLSKIEDSIRKAIFDKFGFEVPVLVKTRTDLNRIFEACPFDEEKKKASYFTILRDLPAKDLANEASEKKYEDDEYYIIDDCIYLFCSKGYRRSKFSMTYFEKKLNTSATARNYNTMVKLLSLSAENS